MLRLIDSFDHYQSADFAKKWTSGDTTNSIVASGRTGNCMSVTSTEALKTLDAQATWTIGFALKLTGLEQLTLLRLYDGATPQMSFGVNGNGTLSVRRNGSGGSEVVLATSVNALSTDTWYYVEFKTTINNSTGTYEARVNGTSTGWIAPATAQDTQQSGNATANSISFWHTGGSGAAYIDDLYVCDGAGTLNNDFLGDVRIEAIFPDANGTNNSFTGSDADSTDNYLLVDEQATDFPDDDTTYVESITVGHKDTYLFEDLAYAVGETACNGIQVLVCAKKTAAGDKTICPVVRVGGTDYDGTNANPSDASYSYVRQVYEQTPEVSPADWTPDTINASEFGHKVIV